MRMKIYSKFNEQMIFNKIVALDSIYHYPDKVQFYDNCAKLLSKGGGSVGVTDVVLRENVVLPIWMSILLQMMNVQVSTLFTPLRYTDLLSRAGWSNVCVLTRALCFRSLVP